MYSSKNFKSSSGFSLLELLVVIAIIGVITVIGVVAYNGYIESAKAKEAQTGLQSIYMQQEEYKSIYKQWYTPIYTAKNWNKLMYIDVINKFNNINILSARINTIPYEILTSLGNRYKRKYI